MKITFISDTHNYHKIIEKDLPGGDLLIHSGDMTPRGFISDIKIFCEWFNQLDNYKHKIFIAGNHDWGFQKYPTEIQEVLKEYPNIIYLQDSMIEINGVKIWGSPWQPFFCNWAFNLPRKSDELKSKWDMIPEDIDILITHGPPFGYLDVVEFDPWMQEREDFYIPENLGCELLREKIMQIKPKIHVFGHIHSGNGHTFNGDTNFVNASVLNEMYRYQYKPLNVVWNIEKNKFKIKKKKNV